jgi:hypothetical protein
MRNLEFEALYAKAHEAGMTAGTGNTPVPMVVGTAKGLFGTEIDKTKPMYFEAGGVCGFAWVNFKGNTPFGRWAKKAGKARPQYPTGLCVWVREFGQSMERKEAYAHAFAKVLTEFGVPAYADCRMD